jgi:hypothetical protein
MKKLLVTFALCAAISSSLAALTTSPATASPTLPLPPPRAALPDLANLAAQPVSSLPVPPILLLRAELTAQLFTQPVGPAYPQWHWIICVVTNSGLIASGPFETQITRIYAGTPMLPGPAIATLVPMNVPAGDHQVVFWPEYLTGPLKVAAYADATHVVPEYNETNNTASLIVWP